ncbi:MAG: diaminopimelate decarboxylase [Candidatus Koribacter versatilis]|uniref:Diaminopimelate decarboxylase n=1 Tax=Candidatus Korobacter versatilis TaxID=658062 RepID=A0A932EN83_9BACT|nr:diaminopimelate decarboxylase [Candidatus Koribacter versatilis]
MFHYRKYILHCDSLPLPTLVEKYGTPLYLYSSETLRARYGVFQGAFKGTRHSVCYSVKANSNLSLMKLLARFGAGFDVVSGGELHRVSKAARGRLKQTVFSGVGKTQAEIDAALRASILLFNVESEGELELLAARATKLRRKARVAFRVNPDVPAETHPYISTGLREHKFGVAIADASRLYRQAARSKHIEVAGVSVHIGSQITDVAPFRATMERVAELVLELRQAGHDITYVDAGGGLGIDYEQQEGISEPIETFKRRASEYAKAVLEPLQGLNVHLLLEPGRALVAPAGVLVTRLLYRKQNGAKQFLITDAAMNDLLRPALYGAQHGIVPVTRDPGRSRETFDVVGPICETGDFLARDRVLTDAEPGELLALLDVGAYGMALASNYNTRPRAAEVLVEGRRAKLVRRRETFSDLLAPEG